SQLTRKLRGIDSVAAVVSWPVFDKGDQSSSRLLSAGTRPHFVNKITNCRNDIDVRAFTVSTDVIGLSDPAILQDSPDRRAMVFDKEPVADVHAVAVDGQGLPFQSIQDYKGNKLLWKLKRPI